MEWTKEQLDAIETKNCKLLIAAGAGSGKTAVLVERIIRKVIEDKVDVDKLLIVTFTNAAASEMRERISDAIYDNLNKYPELNRQLLLLNKASIMTIDAFCKKVIKDNFFSLDLDPTFGVVDKTENELMKLEALDEIMEELYEEGSDILDIYCDDKSDEKFREMILGIYSFIQSSPFPIKWLKEKCEMYNATETDFAKTIWGKDLVEYARNEIAGGIEELEALATYLETIPEAVNYLLTIQDDILALKAIRLNNLTWDDFYDDITKLEFCRLKNAPKLDKEIAEEVKEIRNKVKDTIQKYIRDEIFVSPSSEIFEELNHLYKNLTGLTEIIIRFSDRFSEKKHEKNVIDFSDMEHLCLKLLSENENVCNIYKEKYEEILIDEYQDSNLIQEYILNKISRGNVFMVGDVKQSIYRFRQARPELFLEKYNSYSMASEALDSKEKKILLFNNFRSNRNIIDDCNFIFKATMSKDVGEIDYTKEEYLKFGAEYYPQKGEETELLLIDKSIGDSEELDDDAEDIEKKTTLEARVVAKRIEEIVGTLDVYDKKTKAVRKAQYKDIAILLRATKSSVPYFAEELSKRNIPLFADVNAGYFDKMEVQIIMALLKTIDNPYQDIPLIAVLRSKIGSFTVSELTDIRLMNKKVSFYEALLLKAQDGDIKSQQFINNLEEWRKKSKYLKLGELLWLLYIETGYYDYISTMPNGMIRKNNLDTLLEKAEKFDSTSYKGLFNFITFIDNVSETTGDMGTAKPLGDSDNVVRIMSIHKSKGLEFPIVFLCGAATSFNLRDKNNPIILHQDYGFGADVIDVENRLSYNSLTKIAITEKIIKESISEEMRILYVALTRAREKLIITSLVKDIDKTCDKWSKTQTKYAISKCRTFADWIGQTVFNHENNWVIKKYSFTDALNLANDESEDTVKTLSSSIESWVKLDEEYDEIEKRFNWVYPYVAETKLPSKISVTELKRLWNISDSGEEENSKLIKMNNAPIFLSDDSSGTKFGTMLHNTMQRLDFNNPNVEDVIKNVSKEYKAGISKYVQEFLKSRLFNKIKNARKVWKEKPFNLELTLKELYNIEDESKDSKILVQGVIDLYFETEEGLYLVDYKTDNLLSKDEFIARYKLQLDYYKKALELLTGKQVVDVIIYSFKLGEEISII